MKKSYLAVIALIGVLAIGGAISAYSLSQNVNVTGDYNYYESEGQPGMGGFYSPDIVGLHDNQVEIAKTSVYSTTTIMSYDSGTTYMLSASGTTMTLPKVEAGFKVRFVVNGDLDTGNVIIDSNEGDNIEGSLIVAGAVVDCNAEDQINFVVDGENLGDYVELSSDGSQWLIGDSGVLTSDKMTCTDPS